MPFTLPAASTFPATYPVSTSALASAPASAPASALGSDLKVSAPCGLDGEVAELDHTGARKGVSSGGEPVADRALPNRDGGGGGGGGSSVSGGAGGGSIPASARPSRGALHASGVAPPGGQHRILAQDVVLGLCSRCWVCVGGREWELGM